MKVTEAFPDNPALSVALQETTAGKSYVVTASIPRDFAPADGEGITIRTDDTEKPVIRGSFGLSSAAQDEMLVRPWMAASSMALEAYSTCEPTARPRARRESLTPTGSRACWM